MTVKFTFAVFCQSDEEEQCASTRERLSKFIKVYKEPKISNDSHKYFRKEEQYTGKTSTFTLLDFAVYASKDKELDNLEGDIFQLSAVPAFGALNAICRLVYAKTRQCTFRDKAITILAVYFNWLHLHTTA